MEDAPKNYKLKQQVFGAEYLMYTIYQAPQSVRYLTKSLSWASRHSFDDYFVVYRNGGLAGYYHAFLRGDEWFLNYLAVDPLARGANLGNALLRHYEDMGRAYGCRRLALEVFEKNERARKWYTRFGYHQASTRIHARLALDSLAREDSFSLIWSRDAWVVACVEEELQGFSKIECRCGPGKLALGLIGGHTCKLLDVAGITLGDAAHAVGSRFQGVRNTLIVSSMCEMPLNGQILHTDKSFLLCKSLTP
ncbi:MAG: hypothetical protein C4293_15525 [Nitrospiraceae bacterium]